MASVTELRNMIYSFRVSELQDLLGFAGRNRAGKKQDLQRRALDLLKIRLAPLQMKVIELHKRRFHVTNTVPSNNPPLEPIKVPVPHIGSQVEPTSHSMSSRSTLMPLNYSPGLNYNNMQPKPPSFDYEVKLKSLPFYDVLDVLLQTKLSYTRNGSLQQNHLYFKLSPGQVNNIIMSKDYSMMSNCGEYGIQVQLRFCLLEAGVEQEDHFPPSICVKVNDKVCQLPNPLPANRPGVEPKRPSRPVNITNLCQLSAVLRNDMIVSWASEYRGTYCIAVHLVRRLDSSTLLSRLRSKGVRSSEHTVAMIKEKLVQGPDCEIATSNLKGSLICPIGKMKMQVPCRPVTCTHLQCFDANLFLKMNEKKPRWICPVCDKPATFKSLAIDGLFSEISSKAPSQCTEVEFHEDGSWTPIIPKKETHELDVSYAVISPVKKKRKFEVVDLTLDSDTEVDCYPSMSPHQSNESASRPLPPYMFPTPQMPSTAPFISLPSPLSPSSPSLISPEDIEATTSSSKSPSQYISYTSTQSTSNNATPDAPVGDMNMHGIESSMFSSGMSFIDSYHSIKEPLSPRNNALNSSRYVEYIDFDLSSLLQQPEEEQLISSLPNPSASSSRNSVTPDIISLD